MVYICDNNGIVANRCFSTILNVFCIARPLVAAINYAENIIIFVTILHSTQKMVLRRSITGPLAAMSKRHYKLFATLFRIFAAICGAAKSGFFVVLYVICAFYGLTIDCTIFATSFCSNKDNISPQNTSAYGICYYFLINGIL